MIFIHTGSALPAISGRLVFYVVLASLAFFGSGCATNPATGGTDFVTMSESEEIETGAKMHPQIMSQYRAYPDPQLQDYINSIGQKLAKNSDRPNIQYTFTIIDSDDVNAFATPGGYIYLSRGLMVYLNSEAELAAVLGHEIGHVTARHAVTRNSRASLLNVLGGVAGVAGGYAGAAATNLLGGAYISGYGRKLELEADREGAEYLVRSGYNSDAMIDVVKILKNQELFELERAKEENREAKVYHGIFSTHPDNDKRLREVVKAANALTDQPQSVDNRDVYLQHINGLTFGKVGAGGVISDKEFRHAKFGIGLNFPEGWSIDENRGRLQALSPDRKSILLLSRQKLKEPLSPLNIMTDKIGLRNLKDGRTISADGLSGYTAIAPKANSPYGQRAVRYAVFTDDKHAFVFAGASSDDRTKGRNDWRMLNAVKTFRRLDGRSQRSAENPQITVIEANSATTMATLAAASPLTEFAEQQLRLLNNLYPNGEPTPGQKIKIID